MSQQELTAFIVDFIAGRRQTKLAAFDKDAAKRPAGEDTEASQQQQARRELELRYNTGNWLTDAARRAGQISLVTHAAKFTHGDAKNSSIYSEITSQDDYLSTATLQLPIADAVGNAAALDVAKLLQTQVGGDSLLACLKRQDTRALSPLAQSPQQLAEWIDGFSQALVTKQPSSHKLAKQIYFPVTDGYHLLNPLFATSLAQAMHQRMVALRFSDQTKALWKARRNKEHLDGTLVIFPDTAVVNFGGTKPQNISALNSARGGRVWLLPATPSVWETQDKPPLHMVSLFGPGPFDNATRHTRRQLVNVLKNSGTKQNIRIRQLRDHYIDELIDLLFNQVAEIQQTSPIGWTKSEQCRLKFHQRLWLDPGRIDQDDGFRTERDKDDWQKQVADDFSRWLNAHFRRDGLNMQLPERREWRTRPLFHQRLREMEQDFRRYRNA